MLGNYKADHSIGHHRTCRHSQQACLNHNDCLGFCNPNLYNQRVCSMFPIWNFPLSVYRFRRSRSYTHICLCNLKETTKIKLVERKILQYQILKSYSFNQYTVIGSRSAHFLYFIFLSHYLGNKSGDWSKRTKLMFTLFPNFF